MIGNNVLQLNEATMIQMVQEHLDKVMHNAAPLVTSVKPTPSNHVGVSNDDTFTVLVTDKPS